jgi:hypothetical protein
MAMYQCDVHGLHGAFIVCPHIVQAVQDGRPISYRSVTDDRLIGFQLLCDICNDRWAKMNNDDELEVLVGELQGVCEKCFDEWRHKIIAPPSATP